MINLKKLLRGDKSLITISKEEVEILTYVLCHKSDFENWFQQQQKKHSKIRFVFYYPSAIDLFYDEFKLFTIYFKKTNQDVVIFNQFKLSQLNLESLKTTNWKPFKDAVLDYLTMAQERNTDQQLKRFKSLHDYQQLCSGETKSTDASTPFYSLNMMSAHINTPV